ncbi:MAG: non-ribosomal peptide synthetase, partial [Candidatus Binatia bacterium]
TMQYTNAYRLCRYDRLTLLSFGTSNAVKITFYALLNGLALLPFDARKEGAARLAGWLEQERVSVCWISSPLFRNVAETLTGEERFPELRLIRLASDTVHKSDVDFYKKYFPATCILAVGLSSSETGFSRSCLLDHDAEIHGEEVPVGYSVEGKDVLLLDDSGKEIGFNEVGEIAIKSRYLSPGYWRRPDLTKAKFREDPQGGENRLYLTGDLGLMLPDGCLIHKGRKDFRIKIRGYGVEIAEIEKALLAHPGVKNAIVVSRPNESGEAQLVAYFTSREQAARQSEPNISELRSLLKQKLPDYMIPPVFVHLPALPLTPNGKVDRSGLPRPGNSRPELDNMFAAPRTPVETQLARIWAEVLSLDRVGIHDNFFDLGGHSLAATRVVSRVIRTFQLELPVQALFGAPTVAEMAKVITEHKTLGEKELARILADLESFSEEQAREAVERERKNREA